MATPTPLRSTLRLLFAATLLLLVAVVLMLQDLTTSNRPHELTNSPAIVGITAINVVLCCRMLVMLWRTWGTPESAKTLGASVGRGLLTLYAVLLSGLNALLLAAAAGNLPAVLGEW